MTHDEENQRGMDTLSLTETTIANEYEATNIRDYVGTEPRHIADWFLKRNKT
jgi:hypothetical protein